MTVLSKSINDSYVTKQVKKAAKHAMISSLCNQIEHHEKNLGKKQHGLIKRLLESVNETSPADMKISRFDVFNYQKKRKAMTALVVRDEAPPDNESLVVADQNLEIATINENQLVLRAKGGRPKGATVEKKERLYHCNGRS